MPSLVTEKTQAKFYVETSLWDAARLAFDQQGVDYSEGMTRLLTSFVELPRELRPVILGQAPGDAATAICSHVLSSSSAAAGPRAVAARRPATHVYKKPKG